MTICNTLDLSDTSQENEVDSHLSLISDEICDIRSLFLETSIIALTCCFAKSKTVDLPMPDDAPVTTTVFSFQFIHCKSLIGIDRAFLN